MLFVSASHDDLFEGRRGVGTIRNHGTNKDILESKGFWLLGNFPKADASADSLLANCFDFVGSRSPSVLAYSIAFISSWQRLGKRELDQVFEPLQYS